MAFGTLVPAFEAAKDTVTAPSFMDYLAAGLQGFNQTQQAQQPSYQSMVPPQSMSMQPQMQPQQRSGKHPNQMPTMDADNLMAAVAQRQLAASPKEEEPSILGPLLSAAGGIAGLTMGGPTGAGIGSKIGGFLGNVVG